MNPDYRNAFTEKIKVFHTLYIFIVVSVFITACSEREPAETEPLSFEIAEERVFPVDVTNPVWQDLSYTVEAVGNFLAEEDVLVAAEVSGNVKKIHIEEGDRVDQGQVLIKIDDQTYRHEVNETKALLRESQARFENARATYARMTRLFDEGIIGQHDFDEAVTQVALFEASVERLQASLLRSQKSLDDTNVKAPIAGVISRKMISLGEYVNVGDELVNLVDIDSLKLSFTLPEIDAGKISTGQTVSVTARAYPDDRVGGTVYFISPVVDTDTRSFKVKARVPNPDLRLKPGMFADVAVMVEQRRSLVVPESAVLVRNGTIVTMAVEDDRVVYKQVVPGVRFEGMVEIRSGLSAEDRVVVYGLSEITEGSLVRKVNRGQ